MPLRVLPQFLLRAPLLPVATLGWAAREVFARFPAAREAVGLASPDLRGARGAAAEAAVRRYLVRAAFRPTPHGLLAGVAVGELGERTRVGTGGTRAVVAPRWARLAEVGRALLADPAIRAQARLRRAPSLVVRHGRALWLARGEDARAVARQADLDELVTGILAACREWAPWPEARAAAAAASGAADPETLDDLLLVLVDDGLLHHDLVPPLVGPPPADWMAARLARLDPPPDAPDPAALAAEAPHAVLVHVPRATPTLARAAAERAAALAPLLFRVQDALAPPAAERHLDPGLADALDAVTEPFGAGALDLGALAAGDYGVPLADPDADEPLPAAVAAGPLFALLVERLAFALARGGDAAFTAAELDAVAPPAATPPTFELVLAPAREPRGAAPGTDWLLGLHAPAGATWGRFAAALGAPLRAALGELAAAEHAARPGERRLDVAYAPTAALADLAAHPRARDATLALTSWPDGPAVTPDELELVADPGALEPLALRDRAGAPLCPSPLHRLRSTTAPPGVYRLLAGFSLWRQHAPWALHLGPLAALPRLPRVRVEGFVVAPASWRIPDDVAAGDRRALRRWRRDAGVPRHVQVGHEDELLLVDLDDRAAAGELRRLCAAERPRAVEVWPPLDASVDAGGRRIEAVVAVVDDDAAAPAAIAATAAAGRVPPPTPAAGWRTFKLFGAPDRADAVLAGAVAPAIRDALAAGDLDGWFFLRYVDPPGRREHLRLRVHGPRAARFDARLAAALAPARAAGDVVAVDTAEYFRELARYGGEAGTAAAERVFQSDSELVLELLMAGDGEADGTELLVRSLDALAAGLGLDLPARRALAAGRRAAAAAELDGLRDELAAEYRARQRRLAAALAGELDDEATAALAAHRRRVAATARDVPAAAVPALLHLAAVRLAGPRPLEEARAYAFWDRALDGLAARARRPPRR